MVRVNQRGALARRRADSAGGQRLGGGARGERDIGVGVRERDEGGLELGGRQKHPALEHSVEVARVALGVGALRGGVVSHGAVTEEAGEHRSHAVDRERHAGFRGAASELERGLGSGAAKAGVPLTVNRVGSMLTGFFCDGPVTDYASAKRSDTKRYARYFHGMLERGVFLAPSQFEAAFVSLAHTDADIALAARAAAEALAAG